MDSTGSIELMPEKVVFAVKTIFLSYYSQIAVLLVDKPSKIVYFWNKFIKRGRGLVLQWSEFVFCHNLSFTFTWYIIVFLISILVLVVIVLGTGTSPTTRWWYDMRLQQHFCCGCTDDIGSLQELIDAVVTQRMVYLSTCKGDVAFVVGEGKNWLMLS